MSLKKRSNVEDLSQLYHTEKVRSNHKHFKRVCCGKENDFSTERRGKDESKSVMKHQRKKRYLQEEVERML